MWLEELMIPDNVKATRQLRDATGLPLVSSERLISRYGFRPVIEEGACSIVMLDIDWSGRLHRGQAEDRRDGGELSGFPLPRIIPVARSAT